MVARSTKNEFVSNGLKLRSEISRLRDELYKDKSNVAKICLRDLSLLDPKLDKYDFLVFGCNTKSASKLLGKIRNQLGHICLLWQREHSDRMRQISKIIYT